MADQFCAHLQEKEEQLARYHGTSLLTFNVLDFIFSLVASVGNLLVIYAMWKASSIPTNVKSLFLSLAFTDLAVGFLAQPMRGVIISSMLRMAANGNFNFDFFCPAILTICFFIIFLLCCASCLHIITIAVDRLLAIHLHLRYQELVTSKRIIIALVSLWLSSGVAASIFISLPSNHNMVVVILVAVGLLIMTLAYIHIYWVLRYHQHQIKSQFQQQNSQAMERCRESKSAYNALFVYVVFFTCYFPYLCSTILLINNSSQVSFWAAYYATFSFVFLNSSLNPLVYCWRYREIREIVKRTLKKLFPRYGDLNVMDIALRNTQS